MVHELKISPQYYTAVVLGRKKFELRFNDRNYQVGDTLILREYENGQYTQSPRIKTTITYVFAENGYGLTEGWCILSLGEITVLKEEEE